MRQVQISIGQNSRAGLKPVNEDSYGVLIPDGATAEIKGIAMAIADGISGSEGGKEASETCVKSFLDDYYCTHQSWTVKTSVGRVLSAVNRWLHGQSQARYGSGEAMASTFSALVLKSATAHLFHVGDSRITLLRDGSLEPLTEDHRVRMAGGRDYLGRAMGVDVNVDIDYRRVTVEAGDVFVFTTDGVHDFLSDTEILKLLKAANDLDGAAQGIVEGALAAGSDDNLTCQVVRIDDPGVDEVDSYIERLRALPFPPDLDPGMRLDGYRIVRALHASNRSQVYLAIDEATDERVALKTPSVNYEDDPVYLELFAREEWVGRRLSSPHVAKLVEPAGRRKFLYQVSEYIEGRTLRQWMDDNPEPDLAEVRTIVEQIARGLRAFHRREMVHQDLKPENVMIDRDGTVKIVDFGSARILGIEEVARPVRPEGALGTVGYTAPEIVLGAPASPRADIYSLGVIAYEMLTGKLPYGDGLDSRRAIDRARYTPASNPELAIPAWLDGALAKAAHLDPVRRYDALSAFTADISRPNTSLVSQSAQPLIQRNPLGFWRGLALALLILNITLLIALGNSGG